MTSKIPAAPSKDPERAGERPEEAVLERHDDRREALDDLGIARRAAVFFRQPARDEIELRDQRRALDAGLHASHERHPEVAGADLCLTRADCERDRIRNPQEHVLARKIEVGRHHADDGSHLPGHEIASAEHARIAAEPIHPQVMAQERHAVEIFGRRQPSDLRLHAERREQRQRRARHQHAVDAVVGAQRAREPVVRTDAFEQIGILEILDQELGREIELVAQLRARRRALDHHELLGLAVRQRLEQDGVDERVDGRARSDCEAERADRRQRERGRFSQRAHRKPDLAQQLGHRHTPLAPSRRDETPPNETPINDRANIRRSAQLPAPLAIFRSSQRADRGVASRFRAAVPDSGRALPDRTGATGTQRVPRAQGARAPRGTRSTSPTRALVASAGGASPTSGSGNQGPT